ncbi:TonB C-terminal domain-containing protein, partial [Geoalkalibacter sp.]|uniref:TonB C-terminal domain-containing protein n=1 Tax=Geoalkalibacter sp. TaxID=3041440 RepID=UPI00272E7D00
EPKPEPKPDTRQADLDKRMAELREQARRQEERAALDKSLAALTAKDTRGGSPIPDAPLGMPDGRGTEAGASYAAWMNEFFRQQWKLSKYQVSRLDLEAELVIIYDARGNLIDYRCVRESGDRVFDDSVRAAILREKKLPFEPGRRWEERYVFNLKDLME